MSKVLIAICLVSLIPLFHFILRPIWRKRRIIKHPELCLRWIYGGCLNQHRKLLISLHQEEDAELSIGFSQFGGYLLYGNFKTVNGEAVIETYLGVKGCTFVVVSDKPIKGEIKLLNETDKRPATATYKGHWWQ